MATATLEFAKLSQALSTDFKGTFSHAIPGKRVEVFTINGLDPINCVGYKSIVVHCGINDIKNPEIKSTDQLYLNLKFSAT